MKMPNIPMRASSTSQVRTLDVLSKMEYRPSSVRRKEPISNL